MELLSRQTSTLMDCRTRPSVFFFSSRRRHTRWNCDWSSDVCSSDLAAADSARKAGDSEQERQSLGKAAELYEDDLLPALYDDWLAPIREDYRRQVSQALHRLAALAESSGDYATALPWAERLVALDSLSEANHQLLIRLHAANQDRSSALRAYHQCMRILRREMGVEPGPATLDLYEKILKEDSLVSSQLESARAAQSGSALLQLQKTRPLVGRTEEW